VCRGFAAGLEDPGCRARRSHIRNEDRTPDLSFIPITLDLSDPRVS
jgi:hypothetical protein